LTSQTPNQQSPGGAQQGPPATSPNGIFPPQGATIPGRNNSTGPPHHPNPGTGDGSNNLFASGERGVWAYVQTLEEKVKQLSEQMSVMQSKERSQEEKIDRLSQEVFSLRSQLNAQNIPSKHPNDQGHL